MLGINLHAVVRGAITSVHPDEDCVLFQAVGQVNKKGVVTQVFKEPQNIKASVQPLDNQTLNHLERIGDTKASEQIFAYSDLSLPISGVARMPLMRGGDFIKREDGTYWLVTSVLEDWSRDGWCNAGITMQLTAPDFTASDWHKGE